MGDNNALAVLGQSSALATRIDQEIDLIKKSYAPGATDAEFEMFIATAKHLDLDPVLREIWYVPGFGGRNGGEKGPAIIMPSINGLRKLADMTGLVAGTEGPLFCGPDGKWTEVWLNNDPPAAAKFVVWRTDRSLPIEAVVTFKNRAKRSANGLVGKWRETPDEMLGINAERMAWRRSGLIHNGVREVPIGPDGKPVDRQAAAMARLHAVAEEKGLTHDQARAVASQFAGEAGSMTEMDADDLHLAADLIEAQGANAMPDTDQAAARVAFIADIAGAAAATDKKAWWDGLMKRADGISGGWELLIENAPSEPFAVRLCQVATEKHGMRKETAERSLQAWNHRQQIKTAAAAPNAPEDAPVQANLAPQPADQAPIETIQSWGEFWKLAGRRGYDPASYEALVGKSAAQVGNPDQAMAALNAAERAGEGVDGEFRALDEDAADAPEADEPDEADQFEGIDL